MKAPPRAGRPGGLDGSADPNVRSMAPPPMPHNRTAALRRLKNHQLAGGNSRGAPVSTVPALARRDPAELRPEHTLERGRIRLGDFVVDTGL